MPEKKECSKCKGEGRITVLISQHSNETEVIKCDTCNGRGVIYQMSQRETDDYFIDSCGSDGWS